MFKHAATNFSYQYSLRSECATLACDNKRLKGRRFCFKCAIEEETSDDRKVWLYFIAFAEDHSAIKIGHTLDLRKRISGLQIGTPEKLVYLSVVRVNRGLEELLHRTLGDYRIRGEWYRNTGKIACLLEAARDRNIDGFISIAES